MKVEGEDDRFYFILLSQMHWIKHLHSFSSYANCELLSTGDFERKTGAIIIVMTMIIKPIGEVM